MNYFEFLNVRHDSPALTRSNRNLKTLETPLQNVAGQLSEHMAHISTKDVVLTVILLASVVVSAVGVVYSSHLSRQLVAEQSMLQVKHDQLQHEWAQLLLEQSAWSSPNRIEKEANDRLNMAMPRPEQVQLIY